MKYSRLDQAELSKLEKEFIDFLVVNGITAEDWEKIREDEDKAESMIEAFSDVVWEGILQKTRYVLRATDEVLYAFAFGQKEASLFIARSDRVMTRLEDWLKTGDELELHHQSKPIKSDRQKEIFDLLQQGCLIADGSYYNHLALIYARMQEG